MTATNEELQQYYELQEKAPEHIEVYIQRDTITVTDKSRTDGSGLLATSLDIYQSELSSFDVEEASEAIRDHSETGPNI